MKLGEPLSPATDLLDTPDKRPSAIPRVKRVPVKKGQTFNFVRFFVDDFEPLPYFDGLTGAGVKVAVLDTGCDYTHPALSGRIETANSRNYTNENGGNPVDVYDGQGHGTHCCGLIAAEPRNAIMSGVAPGVTLIVKKVFDNRGSGDSITVATAIRDAVREGADVISMSFGFGRFEQLNFPEDMDQMYRAVQEALAAGVTMVAAASNDGRFDTRNTISPPGSHGGVITVASHDDNGNRSIFSSYGGELDMMAPGEVFSTKNGGGYHALEGTSMATPLVAGLAALFVEAGRKNLREIPTAMARDMRRTGFRARNPYEIRELLRNLCERPNDHNRETGYGRLTRAYQYVNEVIEEDI